MLKRESYDINTMRYRIATGQKILAFIVLLTFIALSSSIIVKNNASIDEAKRLTAADTPASATIFTQQESLVYAVRLTQWIDRQIPRREVQIARALLAQRLAVVNSDGESLGQEVPKGYLEAVRTIDGIVSQSNPGVLSATNQARLIKVLNPQIEILISESRMFITTYQLAVNAQLVSNAKKSRALDLVSLLLLILFIVISVIEMGWISLTSLAQFRDNRNFINSESKRLKILADELALTNLMVFELESLNESKNEFISNISHELRTPLTSIIGYVDVLATSFDIESNPQSVEIVSILDRNATILSSLVQSLLSLSRLDSPHERDLKKHIDMLSITEDAIFILQSEISKKNLQVTFNYDPIDTYIVQGDSGLLSQAAINLMANAVKFSSPSQEIQVSLKQVTTGDEKSAVMLSIRDFGIGIPEDEISRLSERFYRASNARSQHIPGTGLGLAIVAKVVEIHKANLLIDSKLGEGTTFTIQFSAPVSALDELIAGRKYWLLSEAIDALAVNDQSALKDNLHEYGGALGFYDFPELGEDLLVLSRSLKRSSGKANKATLDARDALVEKMKSALPATEREESSVE